MTSGVSSDMDTIKDALWQRRPAVNKGRGNLQKTLQNLEAKKTNQHLNLKTPHFKKSINKTHAVYQNWIEASILNTKEQSAIEQELKLYLNVNLTFHL